MTTPEGTVRAWGARAWIAVTVHVPHATEDEVKALVDARLKAAETAAITALTTGPAMASAYTVQPEHAITVTSLHFDNTGSTT